MTVESTTPTITYPYVGIGDYTFDFLVYQNNDLTVTYLTPEGASTLLIEDVDYTVTLNEFSEGGFITVINGSIDSGYITIRRVLEVEQLVDWVNNSPFNQELIERSFDRVVMMMQQLEVIVQDGSAVSNWRGDWMEDTEYNSSDLVVGPNSNWYSCIVTHVSNSDFNIDLSLGYWRLALDVEYIQTLVERAENAATSAEGSASSASILASLAETSAGEAETSKNQAAIHEANSAENAQESANCRQETFDLTQESEGYRDEALGYRNEAEGFASAIGNTPLVNSSVLSNWTTALNLNTVSTLGQTAALYTGNGTGQDIITGIDSVDFTVASNGSGYWLDRTTNEVKNDAGTVVTSGNATWSGNRGVSKVHIKGRTPNSNHLVYDGLRGVTQRINTNLTDAEGVGANGSLVSFNPDGFTVSGGVEANSSGEDYVAYQELYTHVTWGTTNQGKFYVEAYNPISGFGCIYYIGSGVADHQIPHSQGVKPNYVEIKSLSIANNWVAIGDYASEDQLLFLNEDSGLLNSTGVNRRTDESILLPTSAAMNAVGEEYVCYYKRKSENFNIVQYTGTGAGGNYVPVGFNAGLLVIKGTTTAVSSWILMDNQRGGFDYYLLLDTSDAETPSNYIDVDDNGVMLNTSNLNLDGEDYILIAYADTNKDGGGSYFERPLDGDIEITNGIFNYSEGLGEKGYAISSRVVNKTVTPTGVADGFKWYTELKDGTELWLDEEPSYEYSDTGVTFKDGEWYEDGVLMDNAPSFIPVPIYIASEQAQYLGDTTKEIAQNYTRSIVAESYRWANDGVPYEDPDAIGANPEATLYPDGTIVGSTENGEYTKYPNGDLICTTHTLLDACSNAVGNIYQSNSIDGVFPCLFSEAPTGASASTNSTLVWGVVSNLGVDSMKVRGFTAISRTTLYTVNCIVKGRWK